MRSTIIRTAVFATIFLLPLSLPQSRHNSEIGSIFCVSKASADGTFNRLMRWTGYGWSCGYHACNNNGWGLHDGLPPVGNTAHQNNPAGPGRFELVDPVYPVMHSSRHGSHGHYHTPVMHHNYMETVPMGEVGQSLVVPQAILPSETFQPYRSAIPPRAPSKPAAKSEDSKAASPSDLEVLPSPKGESDDLLLEDQSVRLVPPGNRSARIQGVLKAR